MSIPSLVSNLGQEDNFHLIDRQAQTEFPHDFPRNLGESEVFWLVHSFLWTPSSCSCYHPPALVTSSSKSSNFVVSPIDEPLPLVYERHYSVHNCPKLPKIELFPLFIVNAKLSSLSGNVPPSTRSRKQSPDCSIVIHTVSDILVVTASGVFNNFPIKPVPFNNFRVYNCRV